MIYVYTHTTNLNKKNNFCYNFKLMVLRYVVLKQYVLFQVLTRQLFNFLWWSNCVKIEEAQIITTH